jgi:hypothetical protein
MYICKKYEFADLRKLKSAKTNWVLKPQIQKSQKECGSQISNPENATLGAVLRIRIRDPVPFWVFSRIPDPGSQPHIFESLVTTFG